MRTIETRFFGGPVDGMVEAIESATVERRVALPPPPLSPSDDEGAALVQEYVYRRRPTVRRPGVDLGIYYYDFAGQA